MLVLNEINYVKSWFSLCVSFPLRARLVGVESGGVFRESLVGVESRHVLLPVGWDRTRGVLWTCLVGIESGAALWGCLVKMESEGVPRVCLVWIQLGGVWWG